MASRPLLSFAIWVTIGTFAGTAMPTVPSAIRGLVPPCALDCFASFVSSNYDASGCGTSPSISCLCRQPGLSGFTIGEGAVQCLVAEINRGSCRDGDASQQSITKVYTMCSGVQGAAPATHATIVATLLVPSGTGPVQVPTTATLVGTSTLTSVSDGVTSTPEITTSTTASLPSTAISTGASPAPSPGRFGRNGPALNTAQIAGISVGIAATLGFAVGLIFLARCVRKRNFDDQDSVLFKPKRDSEGFGLPKSNQNSPHMLQISAPIHKTPVDMEFRRPGDFQRPMTPKPEAIGLAISPSRSAAGFAHGARLPSPVSITQPPKVYVPYRPDGQSILKPALSLAIPPGSEPAQKDGRALHSSRDSVMTEFQEDGEAESIGGSNIWRPPPTDPQSTTTYYVADKWGNWVMSSKDGESATGAPSTSVNSTKPSAPVMEGAGATMSPADSTYSNARANNNGSAAPGSQKFLADRLGPPIEFKNSKQESSLSDIHPALRAPHAGPPLSTLTPFAPSVSPWQPNMPEKGGEGQKRRRRSRNGSTPNNQRSSPDSAILLSSSVSEEHERRPNARAGPQDGLSPVVESPRAPVLPVTYPVTYTKPSLDGRVTPQRGGLQGQKLVPTPPRGPQPTLTLFPRPARSETNDGALLNRPGQPSPTLGLADVPQVKARRGHSTAQQSSTSKRQLTRPPGLDSDARRNPAEVTTGSPGMGSGPFSSDRDRQRRPFPPGQGQPYHQHHPRGSSLQLHDNPLPQLLAKPGMQPVPSPPQLGRLGPSERVLTSPTSATTSGSVNSTGSSFLLTKRLGADRAAALTLGDDHGVQSARRVDWQRDRAGTGFTGQDTAAALPATPSWLPRLTPTRRGDDLFLNVQ